MTRPSSNCGTHGYGEATRVCKHLPKGTGLGWNRRFTDDDHRLILQ